MQIRDYQQQVSVSGTGVPGRDARESDFGGTGMQQLGAGLSQAGADVARAGRALLDQQARQEVTDVYSRMAGKHAKWSKIQRDRELAADPADENFATTLQQELKTDLDSDVDRYHTLEGRQAFQKQAAALSAHFVESSGVFQAKLAGVRASENYKSLVNGWQTALIQNPDGLADARSSVYEAINNPHGAYSMIPAPEREKLRGAALQELDKSAVQGWVQVDPVYALAALQAPGAFGNLDADARHTLLREAKTAIHAKEVEKEQRYTNEIRARKLVDQKDQDRLLAKASDFKWTAQEIIESQLLPDNKIQFLNLAHTRAKEAVEAPIRTIPSVALDLFQRVHLPYGDPNKINDPAVIYQAYEAKRLSFEDMNHLRKELFDAATPDGSALGKDKADFFKAVSEQIVTKGPMGVLLNPGSAENMYRFQHDAEKKMAEYQKQGGNPRDLLNPAHKEYLGKPEVIRAYSGTDPLRRAAQAIREGHSTPAPPVAAGKVGKPTPKEYPKPADYLKALEQWQSGK